jgi:hypothetical protein
MISSLVISSPFYRALKQFSHRPPRPRTLKVMVMEQISSGTTDAPKRLSARSRSKSTWHKSSKWKRSLLARSLTSSARYVLMFDEVYSMLTEATGKVRTVLCHLLAVR